MSLDAFLSVANFGVNLYRAVASVRHGKQQVDALLRSLAQRDAIVERLTDTILYAPTLYGVRDTTTAAQHRIDDLRQTKSALQTVERALGGPILSSAMIQTPDLLARAFQRNPWEVLLDIRPAHLAAPHGNPDMVAIAFHHDQVPYVGWQLRGTLPSLFNCEYQPDAGASMSRPAPVPVAPPSAQEEAIAALASLGVSATPASLFKEMGATVLSRDAQDRAYEVIELLLQAGVNPNVVQSGNPAIIYAITSGSRSIQLGTVELLLAYGAHPNARETYPNRRTALMVAVSEINVHMTGLLIRGGADVNAVDASGYSVLRYAEAKLQGLDRAERRAVEPRRQQIVQLLTRAGAVRRGPWRDPDVW